MSNSLQTRAPANPVAVMSSFLDRLKPQMALALPKHMNADRMTRLCLTAFSTTPALQKCTQTSIAGSLMTAAQMGLEPGINGQGYLIPYKETCTFVPGWKGLVDIVNRSGRATVWTGAVFQGDDFDYALGDNPFIRHKPGDEDDASKMTHVYAVGRVNGSTLPVIEVWTIKKIWNHRNKYNKVGQRHYSFRDPEMYARKVPLLQVLKYMPSSIELSNALAVSTAAEEGRGAVIDGAGFVTVSDLEQEQGGQDDRAQNNAPGEPSGEVDGNTGEVLGMDPNVFKAKSAGWKNMLAQGKPVNDLIAMIKTRDPLSQDQQIEIASWANEQGGQS